MKSVGTVSLRCWFTRRETLFDLARIQRSNVVVEMLLYISSHLVDEKVSPASEVLGTVLAGYTIRCLLRAIFALRDLQEILLISSIQVNYERAKSRWKFRSDGLVTKRELTNCS